MRDNFRCANMNHSRLNPPVKFCPSCGESINNAINKQCSEALHKVRRKERSHFCQDCGKKIAV